MYVPITADRGLHPDEAAKIDAFLADFLPRLKEQPGVREIFHGCSPDGRDATTVIVWESEEHARRYRQGDLIAEPIALEQELGVSTTRDGFVVSHHLS